MKRSLWLAVALATCAAPAQAQTADCLGPAPVAAPQTPAWFARDAANMACAEQRLQDTYANQFFDPVVPYPLRDTYREPSKHAGTRFRYDAATITNRGGAELAVDVFRPCTADTCSNTPEGVLTLNGPYPTVLIVHGGASNRQLHWWASQALAEAGYMTIAFDVAENTGGDHAIDAQDMLDWMYSASFPFTADFNPQRVGIAGHSQGASTASLLAQIDPRIQTFVAWDNLTALKEGWEDDIGVDPPADVVITKPGLGIGADYYFTPLANPLPPEPAGYNGEGGRGRGRGFTPHPKDLGYQELKTAGVDTMLFVLRAGTHLDFTPTTISPSSRHGEAVATYLTLAWFDRYLRGLDDPALAQDAFRRLVRSQTFDDSADRHAIGSGLYDVSAGNQPYRIAGLSVCDRMSFYYKSRYALRAPGTADVLNSEDFQADCAAMTPPAKSAMRWGGGLALTLLMPLLLIAASRRIHLLSRTAS